LKGQQRVDFCSCRFRSYDNLIKKEENTISKLSDEEQEGLKQFWKLLFQNKLPLQLEAMDSLAAPFIITQPEFMRREKEMNQSGGGGDLECYT
jgi:molecular chaperone HtpG